MKTICIVVPCYNEQECVEALYEKINAEFEGRQEYFVTVLYVDDGSQDETLNEIQKLQIKYGCKIQYISFARNFGKEAAIYAGLSHALEEDYIALMDADLQHPPHLLLEMIGWLEREDYDCCAARRVSRKGEPPIRSFFSKLFYRFINRVTEVELVQGGSDFRVMKQQVAKAVVSLSETERFTKGIFSWVGFRTKWIEYENVERFAGNTKWSFIGLVRYAINGVVAFATAPLRIAVWLGVVTVGISIVYAIYTFWSALKHPMERTGYSTIVILLLLVGGVIIMLLGVVGEYLARIYLEVKKRPIYIEKANSLKGNIIEDNLSQEKIEVELEKQSTFD